MDDCEEEVWSWWYFNPDQTDPYWIRCTLALPHEAHKDENTGLVWITGQHITNRESHGLQMFRVYKPKGNRVKADQVTRETLLEITNSLMGRVVKDYPIDAEIADEDETEPVKVFIGFDYPTFEGVKRVSMGEWVVRHEDGRVEALSNKEFEEQYELARNTNGS